MFYKNEHDNDKTINIAEVDVSRLSLEEIEKGVFKISYDNKPCWRVICWIN